MKTTQVSPAHSATPAPATEQPADEVKILGFSPSQIQRLAMLAAGVTRYGLVLLLVGIGLFKFTNAEAQAIHPLVSHSPFMFWLYALLDVRSVSALIGVAELLIAVLIALRPWNARLSALGSMGGVLMFLTTLSFLVSTPGMWTTVEGMVVPADGGFLLKDIVLLGGSIWTAAEAMQAALRQRA